MFRWLCIGVLAAVVLGVGSASAQAQNRLLLENSQLDFVVASESAGYACTVEVDSVTLHSRLIVRKVALPSGVLGPAIVVHERVAFDATPPILSCSLVISADEATAVVAFAQALPGTGRELYRAVVNLATGTSDVAEITTAFVAGFDVRIKARRSGDAYYIGFSTSTNSFWVVYFANLAALGTGPGAVTPTSTELVLSSTGWSPVVPTSADMDAAVLGGAPGMVVTIGLFTGGTATSDGMREWSMVNGVKVDAFTGLRSIPYADNSVAANPGQMFSARYVDGGGGRDYLAQLPDTTAANTFGPRLLRMDDSTGPDTLRFPYTTSAALAGGVDWVVARRNTTTHKLDVMRGPAAGIGLAYQALDDNPVTIDSTFCGPAEVEQPVGSATWWRDQNNFVEVQMLPSGRIAIAHIACPNPDEPKLKVVVLDENLTPVIPPLATPDLAADASPGVTLGGVVSVTAALTDGADPTGTLMFALHGPDDIACSEDPVATSEAEVSGNDTYTSELFAPDAAGTYRWTIVYSGDEGNDPAGTGCNADDSSVVVAPAQTSLALTASPGVTVGGDVSNTATLSGGVHPTGTIAFALYRAGDTTCGQDPVSQSEATVTGNGDYTSATYTTPAAGTYRWTAEYSGDLDNDASSSVCTSIVIASPAQTSLASVASPGVIVGGQVSNTATLSGGVHPTGTIAFALYRAGDTTCGQDPVSQSEATVTGNGDYTSDAYYDVDGRHIPLERVVLG